MCLLGVAVGLVTMTCAWGEPVAVNHDFAVYKRDIIERRPFGEPRAEPRLEDSRAVIHDSRPPWSNGTRLVALIQRGRTISVGFLHGGRSYFLRVGESLHGIRVVKAVPAEAYVLLEYVGRVERVAMSRF